jgi:prepilin-type N-terminal cleavage/methylation domain-containing protein
MKLRRPRQHAFTLLELLLVLALTSVLVGMSFQIANSANKVWQDQQKSTFASRAAWSWAHRVCRALRMALPVGGTKERLQGVNESTSLYHAMPEDDDRDAFESDLASVPLADDKIRFVTASYDDLSTPIVVEYAIGRDVKAGSKGIVRRAAPLGESLDDALASEACVEAVSLDFEYLGVDGTWRNEWKAPGFPQSVRVTVGVLDPKTKKIPKVIYYTTVVNLPTGTRVSR